MTDRPPIKLRARLPEGSLNGLSVLLPGIVGEHADDVYIVGRLVRAKREEDDETEVWTAHLRFAEIEVETKADDAAARIAELRSERAGQLQFGDGDPRWDELEGLREDIESWKRQQGLSDVELGARWTHVMGGQDGGIAEAAVTRLREFALTVGALEDPRRKPADDAQPAED